MKKLLSTLLIVFLVSTLNAQDLSKRIANNAEAVVAIKTGNLTSLMSVKKLNKNTLIQMMLNGMSRGGQQYNSIADFGIDLSKTAYYAYEVGEKASYHCLSVPLANVAAFEKLTNSFGETQQINGINAKINSYDKSILAWNKNSLFFVTSHLHNPSNDSSSNGYSEEELDEEVPPIGQEEEIVEVEEIEEVEPSKVPFSFIEKAPVYPGCKGSNKEIKICFSKKIQQHILKNFNADLANQLGLPVGSTRIFSQFNIDKEGNIANIKVRADHVRLKKEAIRVLKMLPVMKPGMQRGKPVSVQFMLPIKFAVEQNSLPKNQSGKQRIAINFDKTFNIVFENDDKLSLNKKRVAQAFARKQKPLKNQSYLSAMNDNNAEAVVWIKDVNGLYGNYFKNIYSKFGGMTNMAGMLDMQKLYGKSEMVLKLFLEKDQMRMSTSLSVDDRWKTMYTKMFNAKVNPKFYNYINTKNILGYVGYAVNTEAVLQEYPKLLQTMLSGVPQAKEYKEEAALVGDLFSLLLDEKAVGDLINGDLLMVLTDIKTKTRSYKSFEYDADYNRKEVTKTKTEPAPEFMTMFSTKNDAFFNKLLHIAQKRAGLKAIKGGYFMAASSKDLPFNMFVGVKDGVVFLTSSENGIKKIMKGSRKSSLTAKQQAIISENNVSFYMNAKALINKIPKDKSSKRELDLFNYVEDNVEDMVIKIRQDKDGKMLSDFIINIPKSSKNALEYFLNFGEGLSRRM